MDICKCVCFQDRRSEYRRCMSMIISMSYICHAYLYNTPRLLMVLAFLLVSAIVLGSHFAVPLPVLSVSVPVPVPVPVPLSLPLPVSISVDDFTPDTPDCGVGVDRGGGGGIAPTAPSSISIESAFSKHPSASSYLFNPSKQVAIFWSVSADP